MVNKPAGFWVRLVALITDAIILSVCLITFSFMLGFNDDQTQLFSTLVEVAYSVLLPLTWVGYTIGKRLLGIRIVKLNGENVGLGNMLLREIVGRMIYVFTFGIGIIISIFLVAFREDKRALHDLIAGTYVTFQKPEEKNPYQESNQ